MNYKIVIFPLFLVTCLINQASPNCQQQPTVKHGHSSSSNVFSFNNLFNQQESSNNQQTWNQNLLFNPFELTFKAPGQTSQSHLGDNSNGLLVNPKVNNLASTSASSSSSGASASSSKVNGGQTHATNRQLFAPGLFDFFQEQPTKVNVNSHGQTVNKGTSVAPKQPSRGKQLLTPLETLKSSSESTSSSSTESTSFSEFPLLFSGLVSATDAQDDADDLLGLIQQHQSQWGQNLPTQLTGPKQGTKVPKVNSGASSLSSSSSFVSASSFPGSSLSLGHSPQQKLPKDDTIKARQQLQNSGKFLQDSISSSVASSPFSFDQLLTGEGPKNGQGVEKDSLTSIFSDDSSSSDSASATSNVKSINQINQLQSTADLIKSLQQKQSNQQQNIEKIESQSPYEQLLSSSGLTPQLLQSLSSSVSLSSSSSSSVPKVNNLGHISKSHEKHPAVDLNSFFQQESDNQNRNSIVDRGNKGALNIPAQVEQKTNEQTKPVKSSVTIPLLTFPSTSKHSSGRPERSGSANIHSQNSKSGQTGTSARINNHGSVTKPVKNTEHDTLFSSFSSSFTPIFNSAFQIQSNEQQNLADLATIIQRQQNQKLTDQQKRNKDQSQKSSQTSIPSSSSSSSTDSSSLSTEQIQKLNTFDLLKLIQQENNEEKTNSNEDLATKIGQNSDKSKHQPPINTNKPTSSSPSSLSASTSVVSTSPSTSKLSTSQTVLPLSSINAKLQSDSLINSAALSLAALSSSNLGSPITTANSPLINGKTNVPLSATESESSSDSSSTSGSSLISALNKLSQTPILPSSKSLSSSTSSQDSVISNQQIINQNLPVKNEKSTDHRQIQTDQNKQYNKQKTPSIIDSQPSLQLHSKSDLKTPIQSLPIEQVTENIKNQQKSSSTLPTTTSSLTALTDLSSLSTGQIQQLTKADFIGLLQNQNNKEKPTSHESLVPNIRQNSGKPTVSSDTESSSVSSSNSAFLTLPSTTKLSKQMSSSSAESSGTHLPLSVTASEAAIAAALSSLSDLNDDDDDDDDDDDETEDEESTEESSEIVKQSVRPVQTPIQPSSPTDLSSLSTARIQKINTEDLLKLTHPQNRKDKTTSEESSAPIIGQNSDKSKNRPTANTKPSPSSSSSAHSTFPLTLNSESNNNKQKLSAAQIYSEAGSMLTASSSLSDEQIKSLTASPSPKAKSSSLVSSANLDSLTTPPNTKLSKQLPTGTDVSSGENLPLVATNAAIGAGSAIATASALSSSDSDSSSALLPHLQSPSLGYLSLQNDNQDSTDLKSGSIVTPLNKPTQTLIVPSALSSSSLSTDLSSLTAEQIQQLTPEDLIKLLKKPNNQLDKTLSGVIPQNADQISGKDTKPLTISSGASPSSSSHTVLPSSSTSPSAPSLNVQPAASIQLELTDSLTTSALASASVLSWLSAEQINQLTEAELMALIQQQQNNQRDNISQKSSSSNGEKINEKGKNQEIKSMQAQANSALSVKPTPTTQPASEHSASSRVSSGQIHPTSSFNVNRILQNQNNGLTNQQAAIVGSLSKHSQTPILPSSLSKSTSSQDSIISNQQIINQNLNLPVKNKESVDRRQPNSEKLTQTEQNKQRNEQKTPSSMESHPSLQSHFKVDLKTPIKSPPSATEQVTEKSNNQQKLSTSASPTTPSSSLTSSTPLVSTAIESSSDSSSPSVSSLITAIPISDQKSKAPTNKQTGIQPTTSSSSPSTAPSKTSPSPSIGFKSIPESSANSDDHSQHQNKGPPSQIAPINGLSVKPLISNPSSTTSSMTSLTDLSSLSTGQIQQLTKADLITLLQNQNNKEKPTSQESSAPIIEQSSDRSKNRPTAPSSSSSTHSTSPPTSNSESNNNKHKSSAAQINSEAGSMLTASSWLSDEQIKSLTASPSTNAKSSSLVSSANLDSLTTQPNTKLPKQTTISSGASLEADLPLSATAIAAAAGTAITTGTALASASALSSSDADSDSSDTSTLLQSFSLDGLGSLLDDEDSIDQKSDAVRSPKKVVQTLSALPTPALSSSLSSSTDLSSSSTGQTLSTELLKVMQQQKNKEKGASQVIIAPKTAQISNNQPSLSVGSSVSSKSKPVDNKQMPSIIDTSLETYLPLSATAIAAGLSSTDSDSLSLLSGASKHRNKVTTDEKPGIVHQPPSKKPSPTSTASSSSPSTFISSSTTGLSSLSAEQIQKLPSEDLNKLLKQQNDQLDETVEESESQNNDQISSKNKKPTFSTHAAQTSSVSPSNPALTSKLSKQITTGTGVSSEEDLPITATDLAIGAGTATASALSSSDSDSSSALLPLLQSPSLGDLSLQNDNKDSTDLKSGSIVTPLNRPTQTSIVPSALSSSSLSTDLSSLTAEQIQQLTPEDLIKLLKKPNNQLDRTLKESITKNADQISGKDTKPLTISSGTSPSSSSHSVLPSSSTLPSTSSLHVQPAASIQSELADSLTTSALASASALSWLSAEQINQLTEAELIELMQQQQNNQRDDITQGSINNFSNTEKINEKAKNHGAESIEANSGLLFTPTSASTLEHSGPSYVTASPVSTGQIQPTSSVNVNSVLQNRNNGLTNQQAIVGLTNKPSQTPIFPSSTSLSSSTPAQDSIISNQKIINQNLSLPVKNDKSNQRETQTEQNIDAISSPSPTSSLTFATDLSTLSTEQIQQLTKADLIALLQNQNNKEKPTSHESLVPNVRQNSDLATAIATAAALSSLSDSDETDDEESTEETSDIIRQSVRPVQTPITSSSSPTDSLSTEQIQKLNTADLLQPIQQQNSKTKITSQKTLAPIIGQSSDNSANQPTVSPNVESPTTPSASLASPNLLTLPTTSESFTPNIEQNSDKSKNKPTVSSDTDSSSTSSSDSAVLTLPSKLSKQIPSSSEIDLPLTATDTAIATGTAIETAAALSSSASSLLSAAQVQSSNLHSQQQNNDSTKQKSNLSGPLNKSSQTSIAHPSPISPSPIPSQDSMTSNAQIITPNLNKPTLSDQTSSTSTQSNLLSQLSPSHSLGINSDKSSDHQQVETNSEKPIAKHNSQKSQQKIPSRVDTSHSKSTPHSLVSLPFSLSTNSGHLHSSNRQPSIGSTRLKHQQHGKNQNIHPTESQTNKGATNRPTSIIQSSKVPIDASKTLASTSTSSSSASAPSESISTTSSLDSPPAIHQQSNQQTQPSESSTSLLQSNQPESQINEQRGDETLTRKSTLNGVSNGLFTGLGLNTDSLTSSSASNSALQSQLDVNKQSQIIQNEQNNKWTADSQVKTPSMGRTDKNFNLNNPIIDAGSSSFPPSSSSLLLDKQIEVPETTDLTKSGQQQTTRLSENTSLSPSQTVGNEFQMKSDEQHDLDALTALAQEQRNNEKSTNSGQTMQFTDQNLTKQGLSTPRMNSDSLSSSSAPKLSSGNAAKTLLSPNNDELSSIIHQMGSNKDSSSTSSYVSSLLSAEQIQQLTPNDLIKLIQQKNKETTDQEVINREKFDKSLQTSGPSSVSSLLSAERIQQLTPAELLQMIKQNDKEKTNSAKNFSTKVAQSSDEGNSKSTVSTDARSSSSAPTVNVLTLPSTSIHSKQIPSSTTVNSEIDLPLATATATAAETALLTASALSSLDSDSSSVNLPLLKSSSKDDLQLENADSTKQSNIARPSAILLPTSITSSPSSFLSTDLSSNEQIQKLNTDELIKLVQEQTNKEKTNEGLAPNVGQNGNKNKNHPTINTATATQSSPSSLSPSTSKLLTTQSVIPLPSMNEQLQSDSLISSAALPSASLSSSNSGSPSTTANSPVINGKTDVPLSAIESESLSDTSSTSDSSSISALNKLTKTPILPSSTSLSSSTSSQDSMMSNQQIINQNLNLTVKNEKSNQRKTQTEQNKHSNEQKTPSLTDTPIETSLQPHFTLTSSPIEQVNENIKNQQKSSSALPTTTSSSTSLIDLSSLSTDQIQKLSKSDLITLLQNQNNKEKPTSQETLVSNIEQNSNKPKLSSDAESLSSSSASSSNLALSTLPATSKLSKQIPNSSDVSSKTVLPQSAKSNSENALKLTQPQNHKDKTTLKESLAPIIGRNHDKSPNQPTVSPNVKYPSSASGSLSSSSLLTLPSTEPVSNSKTINVNKIPSSAHVSSGVDLQSVSELGFTTNTASASSSLPSLSGEQIPKHSTQDQNKLLKQQNNQLDKTSEGRETQNADQINEKDTKPLAISSGTSPSSTSHSPQSSSSILPSTSSLLVQPSGLTPSASPDSSSSSSSSFDSASALSALSLLSAEQTNQLTAAELIQLIQQQNNQRDSNSQGRESSPSTNLSSLSAEQIQQLTPESLIKLLKQQKNQSIKTSEGSETNKADLMNDKGTKPIAISSDASSLFSSPTTSTTSALLTSPSTSKISSDLNSESINNKQLLNSNSISSKTGSLASTSSHSAASALMAGQIPQASSISSDASQISSASPSNPTLPLISKNPKQLSTGTDASSEEDLPLTATDLAIGAGTAIATASALSSSDSDSSSALLPLLHSSSLGYLSLQNDNQDSTDLKSGSIVTPLNKPPQTLIAPSALSSSFLSTDLSSLTAEQIQQLTPEDLVKLLKQPNNQLDKTLSGVIPQNADQISGKDTKPLTISSGTSPSSSSHSALPSSPTLPSTPSLHVQPAASIQSELSDSLSTSALASTSALSLLSSEQINQLTEAELIELIQKQQNNQREGNSQRSKSSNSEKDTNQVSPLTSASSNPALLVTPTPATVSMPVSTKQIRPSSSVNLNNGLVNQQAIVGSLNTPSSLSSSTPSQDSIISNQQIINQNLNLPVKNKESVDRRQPNSEKLTQTEQNKQSNEQKTPSPMGSQPSLQSHPKVDLKTPIKSPPSATEQVTEKSNNQQKLSTSASPTTPSSSLTSSTPLVSTAIESSSDSSSPSVASLITAIPIIDQKDKAPTNQKTGIVQPLISNSSSSPSTVLSAAPPSPSLSFKPITKSSGSLDDQHQNKGSPIQPIKSISVKSANDAISSPSLTSSLTSATDLSSLSTEQIQQLTKADLITLLQNQNNKEKPTSQETLVPNIRQNSDTPTINSDTESSSTPSTSSSNLALSTLTSKPSKQIPNSFDVSSSTVSPLSAKATAVPIPTLSSDSDSSSPVSSMLLAGHIQSPSSTDLSPQQTNNDLIEQKTNLPLPLNKPSQTSINHSSPSSTSSISSQDSTISNPQIITPDLSISTLTNQGSSSNLALLTLPSTSKLSKQLPSNDVSSKTDLSSSATGPATAIVTAAVLSPPSALSSSGSDSDSSILPSLSTLQASSSDELGSQNDNKDSTDQQSDMVRPSEKAAQTPVSPSPSSSSSSSTDLSSTEQALSTESLKVIQQKNKEKGASQESIAPKIAQISNMNDNQPSISASASLKQQNNKFDKTSKESEASNADQINDRDTKPLTISFGESTSSSPHSAQSSVLPSTLTLPLTSPSASLASPNLLTLPTTSESFTPNIEQNSDKSKNKPTVSSDTDSSSTSSSDSAVLTLPSKLSKQIPSSSETDLPLTATDAAIATGTAITTAPVLSSSNSGSFPVTLPLSQSNDLNLQLNAYDSTDQQSDIVRQSKKPAQITIASTSVPSTSSSSPSSSTDLSPLLTAQNQKLTTTDLQQIQKQNNKEKTTSEEGLASNIGLNIDQSKKQPTMSTDISLPSPTGKPSTSIPSFLTLPSTTKLSSSESPLRSQSNINKQITSSGHVNTEADLSLLGATNSMNTASALSSSNPNSSSLQSSKKIQMTSSDNLHLQHQNKGTANQKSIVTPLDKLTQTSIAPSSLSSSSLSTDLSSLTADQIQQLTPQDLIKLLKQPNNQLDKTSSGIITQNADQISGKDTKPLTISSGTSPSTSSLHVQPAVSIPSASQDYSSSSSFDSASALSALSLLSAEQTNQLTAAELIQLIQQQNNQRDSNSQGSESSPSTNLSSLSAEQIQQLTPESLIKLLKKQDSQSTKTSEGSETIKADQINDKGTKPIAISSDVSSSFSSPTTSSTSALLTSPSTSKISSDLNSQAFNNKQMTNSDHMSSKTGSSASTSSSSIASALLAGQIPQGSSVDSPSDLKQQHDGVTMQQSGPSRLSEQPSQTQIAVPSASLDSTSLSNEQMQQLSQADLIKLLKEQNNKFGKTSKLSETNNVDQSKDTKSTTISTDASSTSTLLISPSESSDSSSSAIVDLGSQHQNKGMNDQQKSIVRPTSASSSLSAQQQTTATDQVKQTQNKNIEPKNLQASNIDKMKASSQESSPSVTDLSSLTTEQIRQLTATELLELLKQKNNQWTINGQGGESPNNEQISNTGNKQSTLTMSTPSVRPSPSSSASSTSSSSSSSSTSSLLASPKQNQQTNKLKQQNVGLTNQQSLNHVLLNKPSQVPISSVLPSSSSVAHKDQNVDNQSTKVSMINTNQSPKDSLLPPASAISSGLASSTTSFDAGQINPSNQASTQDLSQENSASSHSFNQQGKQSSLSTHTRPNKEVKHPTKPGETSPSLTTASSSSSSSTSNSGLTPSTSSVNPTSSVQVNAQHNQKDRGTSGKQTSDFDTGKLADVSSLSSSSASLTPLTTLNEKNSSNQKLTLDDLMKLVQQQQQNNQWNTNSQGERASIGQLLSAIGSINESTQSSSSSSSIPLFNVDQKQMEHTNQFNQNKKTDSQSMQMNKQGSTNPIISEDTSASTSASSSSSSESSSSTASTDKIQLSKQQQLDLFKLIQQTQYSSKESAALASQFGINRGTTLLSPISSSSSTQSSESVPSSLSLSTTNTEQVYFSKQQIVAYLIALIQAQLAKSPQGASPVSSSFSSTYDSTQNYQTDEQQIVVLLIEILQQQQQNDHPTSSLLSLLSKNLFIISELPPQLLSLITSLFTTSLSPRAEHLSTINNQMNSADLKRLLQQIKQQSDVEKQLKSQIGSQREQQLDSSQLISALSRLSSMPQTNAPSVGINPANVQSNKQWNLNSQQQAAIKALQSSQQYKPVDDPSAAAAAASSSMDSQLFEYPILMDPTNTKGLIPTMEDIAEQGILTLENFASDLLGR